MPKLNPYTLKKHILVSMALTLLTSLNNIFLPLIAHFSGALAANQASSIGIIGGADGPTVYFFSTSLRCNLESKLILFTICLLLYIPIKRLIHSRP